MTAFGRGHRRLALASDSGQCDCVDGGKHREERQSRSVLRGPAERRVFEVAEGTGRFFVSGTSRFIFVTELAVKLKREHLPGFEDGTDEAGSFESPPTFPNGCHICEVEIDPDTGAVSIAKYVVVDDVGTVINPLIVDGQIQGGVAQGLGQKPMENCVYDPESGQLMTATFVDYVMPRADDMPNLDISYNEILARRIPLGAKGAGEAGTIGSLPAIIGAISDALNVTHIDMPVRRPRKSGMAQAAL